MDDKQMILEQIWSLVLKSLQGNQKVDKFWSWKVVVFLKKGDI